MIPLGLSGPDHSKYLDALADNHSTHIRIQLMTLSGNRLDDLTDHLLDGQVNIDWTADVTRSCTLSLLDPKRRLPFDGDSPAHGALFLDRMLKIHYSVRVPGVSGGWVDVPVFTGPVSKLDRQDDVVEVEAQGKEALAMGSAWLTHTFPKGRNKIDTIRAILRDYAGENRFDFPEGAARLPKPLSISRTSVPWTLARSIAHSIDKQLYYDGRGICRLRNHPDRPLFTFRTGDGGTITSYPQVSYSSEDLKNIVLVKGGIPKGSKSAVQAYVAAANAHPLSPQKLGRVNGAGTFVPRYLLEVIENSNLRTKAECRARATTRLKQRLLQVTSVTFDALPVPHLDPGDMVRVHTSEFSNQVQLSQFSLPLKPGDSMSVGYTKRVSVRRRPIHRR